MRKRCFGALVALIVILVGVNVGCATGDETLKQVIFTHAETDPAQFEFFNWMAEAYEKEHPNVYVSVEKITGDKAAQVFAASILAGEPMGVFNLRAGEVLDFARRDAFLPLDPIIGEIGRDQFAPGGFLESQGHAWAVGNLLNFHSLNYRKDLLDAAGLGVPRNHQELLNAAQKLTLDTDGDGTIDMYGIAFPASPSSATDAVGRPFFWQKGTSLFDRQLNPIIDNNPRVIDTLEYVAQLLKQVPPGAGTWGWLEHRDLYQAEKVAMSFFWGRYLNRIGVHQPELAKVTGVTVPPGDPIDVTMAFTSYYVIGRTVRYPEETLDLLKWLISGEPILRLCSALPGHDVPVVKEAAAKLTDYIFANPDLYPEQTEYVKNHKDWIEYRLEKLASQSLAPTQLGAVQDGEVDWNFFPGDVSPEKYSATLLNVTGEPTLVGQMFYKIYEGWTAEEVAAWAQKEAEGFWKE